MQGYNNGHVIDVSKIPITDYENAAKEWSEGSHNLEALLLYCLKNNIVTYACCIGHKDKDKAYLQFEFSEKNMSSIIKITNRYYHLNGVNMIFLNQPGVISKFAISVPQNIREQFFEDMLSLLSNRLNIGLDSLSLDMRSTIDAVIKHKIPNDYLEVQYSNVDNQKKIFVAAATPSYSESYWNTEQAIPWTEKSVGIKGTPEQIIPILNDISRKSSYVYDNYIETKWRTVKRIESSPLR